MNADDPSAMPASPMPMEDAAPAMDSSEVCIPIGSLSMQDDTEKAVAPAVGDPVDFQATGTVTRVEGDNAYVALESVNGDPIPKDEAEPGDPTESDMRSMAAQADDQPEEQ